MSNLTHRSPLQRRGSAEVIQGKNGGGGAAAGLRLPVAAAGLDVAQREGGRHGRDAAQGLEAGPHDVFQEGELALGHVHSILVAQRRHRQLFPPLPVPLQVVNF